MSHVFCTCSLDLISSDGYQFINLFKTLSGLIAPPPNSELATPLIDSKNGVLGKISDIHFLFNIKTVFFRRVFKKSIARIRKVDILTGANSPSSLEGFL